MRNQTRKTKKLHPTKTSLYPVHRSISRKKVVSTRSKSTKKLISVIITDYGHTMAKSQLLCGPNSNPNPK